MYRYLIPLLVAALLPLPAAAGGCEGSASCGKCGTDSEMSWNPEDKLVSERLNRFYSLEDLTKAAYQMGDMTRATALAKEYLGLAPSYPCNWNYGNAIHDANRYLGLISLKSGDRKAAAAYLTAAGKSTGSPQLDTFGPDLDLANALLKEGQTEPVMAYLRDIQRFWRMDNGQVADWLADIEKGGKPELNRFLKKPDLQTMLLVWFSMAWPLLVVSALLAFHRRRMARKWLFGVVGVVSGYLAMMAAGLATTLVLPWIIGVMDSRSPGLILAIAYSAVAASFLISLAVVFGTARLFVLKNVPSST